jgi:hypothetical protein
MLVPLKVVEQALTVFPGSSLVVLGCAADGRKREYCEVNMVAYPAIGSPRLLRQGKQLFQLIPVTDPLLIVKEPHRIVKDDNWNVSTVLASSRKMKLDALQRFVMEQRETEAMKFLVLGYTALDREDPELAGACTLSALARLAEAVVLDHGVPVHPSHLAEDLRTLNEMSFFSDITDFDLPSSSNCSRRTQKISGALVHDEATLVRNKLEGLARDSKLFDCLFYSYWCLAHLLDSEEAMKGTIVRELGVGIEVGEIKSKLNKVTIRLKQLVAGR